MYCSITIWKLSHFVQQTLQQLNVLSYTPAYKPVLLWMSPHSYCIVLFMLHFGIDHYPLFICMIWLYEWKSNKQNTFPSSVGKKNYRHITRWELKQRHLQFYSQWQNTNKTTDMWKVDIGSQLSGFYFIKWIFFITEKYQCHCTKCQEEKDDSVHQQGNSSQVPHVP